MAKKNKHSKGVPIRGAFTPILNDIHDSVAYRELSGNAAKLYHRLVMVARIVAFKLESSSEYIVDFDFTYSEAKRHGFSESTTRRALHALWSKGFIDVIQIGGRTASKKCGRMSSKYKLCDKWKSYGQQWKDRSNHETNPWQVLSEPVEKDAARW